MVWFCSSGGELPARVDPSSVSCGVEVLLLMGDPSSAEGSRVPSLEEAIFFGCWDCLVIGM
jgi:hypothetical protein